MLMSLINFREHKSWRIAAIITRLGASMSDLSWSHRGLKPRWSSAAPASRVRIRANLLFAFVRWRALFFPGPAPIVFAPAASTCVCSESFNCSSEQSFRPIFSLLLLPGLAVFHAFFLPSSPRSHIKDTKARTKRPPTPAQLPAIPTKEVFPHLDTALSPHRHRYSSYTRIWLLHASVEEKSFADYN
jgi:hypothetical protein